MTTGRRRGFMLYLAFLVTTVLFFLVLGGQDVARLTLDLGRSGLLEITGYQAADGGLERGLARLRRNFSPLHFSYESPLGGRRIVLVEVTARHPTPTLTPTHSRDAGEGAGDFPPGLDLLATATILEGGRPVSRRCLMRIGVQKGPAPKGSARNAPAEPLGRKGTGLFMEAK